MRHDQPWKRGLWSLVSVAALAAGACTMTDAGGTAGTFEPMAATYRYMFANNASALKNDAATYCVGIGAGPVLSDPPAALLTALADVTPEVRPASHCRAGTRVVNAAGQPSLMFNLAKVRCESATDCLFQGGYYEANASASSGQYHARLVNGEWQVAPEGPQAIS